MKMRNKGLPALIKGNGKPVGGIELINISHCIKNFYKEKTFYCSISVKGLLAKTLIIKTKDGAQHSYTTN